MTRRRRGARDGGFTTVELIVVIAIGATVMASLIGVLDSQTRMERRVSALASNQEQVRQALVQIQRDLRSAEPLVALANPYDYPRQVDIIHLDFATDAPVHFRWRVDSSTKELVREVLGAGDAVTATTFRLRGMDGAAVFRYFSSTGDELVPQTSTSSTIADCTIRVRVTLAAAPESGPRPLGNASDVQLRNRLPGSAACGP